MVDPSAAADHPASRISRPVLYDAGAMSAVLRPVRSGNAFEECVERLLSAIKLGIVDAGERLPAERELARVLDVSRMTLREAIQSLRQAGYVESRRGRTGGTFVTWPESPELASGVAERAKPTIDEVGDMLTLRDVLEVGAAETAARLTLSDAQRHHLASYLDESRGADRAGYRRADSRLHLAIAEVTGSASLVAAVADVRMRVNDLLDGIPLISRNLEHSNEQHQAVVEAILDGDVAVAREKMVGHLAGTAALLRAFLG